MESDPIIHADAVAYLERGGRPFNNVCVVGASGLLGSYLLDFISDVNIMTGTQSRVLGFSRTTNNHLLGLRVRSGLSLKPIDSLEDELAKLDNIHVIHAASPASPEKMNDTRSLFESNYVLTERISTCLEKSGGRMTYFSSGEVYGDSPEVPTAESGYSGFDHLGARGFYPEIKRFSELLIKEWSARTGIPATALRIFHTFGPGLRADDTRIFAEAIFNAALGGNIRLRSDGSSRRSFLYTSDLAEAIQVVAQSNTFEAFNVCGSQELSILEFANKVAEQQPGCKVELYEGSSVQEKLESPIKRGLADTSKLRELGWKQGVGISDAISRTMRSVQARANYAQGSNK